MLLHLCQNQFNKLIGYRQYSATSNQQPGYKNIEQQKLIESQILAFYDAIREQVEVGEYVLPDYIQAAEKMNENFLQHSELAHWCRGFDRANALLEPHWQSKLKADEQSAFAFCVINLSFFADKARAQAFCQQNYGDEVSLQTLAESIVDTFQESLNCYVTLARKV